ncbi:MAG: hypothetical protein HYW63_02735 [Candidatus Levybacteria bacterium]|nr:hypothetical protein [Candidatus Levybacteria bacterium]
MKISLVGMSGSGKTYWSKKLGSYGFRRYCCDDLIEEKLERELKHLGYSGIADVSKWMGQPFDRRYPATSKKYLQLEEKVMEEILSGIEKSTNNKNIVIDTTGSVIYIGEGALKKLTRLTKVIYFKTPDSVKKKMYRLYLQDPKPVIWGNAFNKKINETDFEALERCYPKLLAIRAKKYEKIAGITLGYKVLHDSDFSTTKFMEAITALIS